MELARCTDDRAQVCTRDFLPSRQSTKIGIKAVIPVASEGKSAMKAKICAKLVGT